MWGTLLKTAVTLKTSNLPQSLLHQIGLAGGTRYVNSKAGSAKEQLQGRWWDRITFLCSFYLFFPQQVFLVSAIAPLCMFSGHSPELNFRKLGIKRVHLRGFTHKTCEHKLPCHAVVSWPSRCQQHWQSHLRIAASSLLHPFSRLLHLPNLLGDQFISWN